MAIASLTPAIAVAAATQAPAQVRGGQVRLTPAEIDRLAKGEAGPGTSGIAGIRTTILLGDPAAAGPYVIALQVPANTQIAAHSHRDARSAVVVSGTWYFGYGRAADAGAAKALPPGSVYTEAAGDPHFAMTRDMPATVYISGYGPTDTQYTAAP
ncbi:hypothetical protein ETR14_05905 [Sphingosinicella sp. BN140058]|nr:hypothetical protein ETR14_05905 [Sphingosinicella sp. BN140058]